jgi:hypothetical protein
LGATFAEITPQLMSGNGRLGGSKMESFQVGTVATKVSNGTTALSEIELTIPHI